MVEYALLASLILLAAIPSVKGTGFKVADQMCKGGDFSPQVTLIKYDSNKKECTINFNCGRGTPVYNQDGSISCV